MVVPREAIVNCDTEVLSFFHLFESLTMETITCFKRFFLVGDAYMFAFIRIELHFPGVFPLLEPIEITLYEFCISFRLDCSAHQSKRKNDMSSVI